MGWPEMAGKLPEITKLRCENGAAAVGFAGQIPGRPTAVGRKILRPASSGGGAPRGPVRVAVGYPEVPRLVRSSTSRRWLNDSTWFPVWRAFS